MKIPFMVFMSFASVAVDYTEKECANPEDLCVGFWSDGNGYHIDIGHKDTFDENAAKFKRKYL